MGHVTLRNVTLAAGKRTLLREITLDVRPGELVVIVGPNGVGKSTLARAIAGAHPLAAGTIAIDGREVASLSATARARAVALTGSGDEDAYGASVRDVVAVGRFAYRPWWQWTATARDRSAVDAALERVALRGLAERPYASLSSGERQRVWLALALAQSAEVVLLDEPTAHLDPRYALEVLCLIRGLTTATRSAIVVLHDLNEAAMIADRIAILGDGRLLAFAEPSNALEPEILERAYGVPFDRVIVDGAPRVLPRRLGSLRVISPSATPTAAAP